MKKIILFILLIMNLHAIDTQKLLTAHKKALITYQSPNKDFYTSIELLRNAGIQKILEKKPEGLTTEQYSQILNDYGFFLSLTEIDSKWYGPNYCEAKNALEHVQKLVPDRAPVYLNLGDLYWKIYKANITADSQISKMARHSYHDANCIKDEVSYPYMAKQMYEEYERRMILQGKQRDIPQRIMPAIKNDKVHILIRAFDKEDEPLCKKYIDELNRFKDDHRTFCNRDFSTIQSEFELLPWDNLSKANQDRFGRYSKKWGVPIKFKNHVLFDYIGFQLYKNNKRDYFKPICDYKFFDFSLKKHTAVDVSSCPNIEEYE